MPVTLICNLPAVADTSRCSWPPTGSATSSWLLPTHVMCRCPATVSRSVGDADMCGACQAAAGAGWKACCAGSRAEGVTVACCGTGYATAGAKAGG